MLPEPWVGQDSESMPLDKEMTGTGFNQAFHSLGRWGFNLKSYILTRRRGANPNKTKPRCDIACNLSDERTFFAWQRNHMANERTFLAWCRTGIALIVYGFVIERFDLLIRQLSSLSQNPIVVYTSRTKYLGVTTFVLGAMIIILAGWRFYYIRSHINRSEVNFTALPDLFLLGSVLVTVCMTIVFFIYLV